MWTILVVLLGLLIAIQISSRYFRLRRQRHPDVLENRACDLAVAFRYNLFCYLLTSDMDRYVRPLINTGLN
jgi:hypothetical protein